MAQITLRGNAINTCGDLPSNGSAAPQFTLTNKDLGEMTLASLAGKNVILNIYPSIDTPTCATSTRTFNELMSGKEDTVVVCVSADLPFAQSRFCGAEGLENVHTASTFRNPEFGEQFGVTIIDGPLAGLMARAIVVMDGSGKVVHTELVSEIAQEPNYDAAMSAVA
ncbi:MAG: thiol peroxidase [bacterium]|jgi:thiol peroxidase